MSTELPHDFGPLGHRHGVAWRSMKYVIAALLWTLLVWVPMIVLASLTGVTRPKETVWPSYGDAIIVGLLAIVLAIYVIGLFALLWLRERSRPVGERPRTRTPAELSALVPSDQHRTRSPL